MRTGAGSRLLQHSTWDLRLRRLVGDGVSLDTRWARPQVTREGSLHPHPHQDLSHSICHSIDCDNVKIISEKNG